MHPSQPRGVWRRFIHRLLVRSPSWARQLGLAREHVALAARHDRVHAAWTPHLAASRAAILAGAERCASRHRALVIGAGACRDVPVAELTAQFDEVILADVVIGLTARRLARTFRGRVRAVTWDATGTLARLAEEAARLDATGVHQLFATADAGPPPGGEPDLVVSANCMSQLGLVPAHYWDLRRVDEAFKDRCALAAARRHLTWLGERQGVRVLIADMSRLDLAPDGRELKRDSVIDGLKLRPPDRTWRWNLAPIPEWSPKFHRVHEVGAWIDA